MVQWNLPIKLAKKSNFMRSAQPNYILSRTGKVFITNLLIYFYESFVSKYSLSAFSSVEYEILRNLWRNIILK